MTRAGILAISVTMTIIMTMPMTTTPTLTLTFEAQIWGINASDNFVLFDVRYRKYVAYSPCRKSIESVSQFS